MSPLDSILARWDESIARTHAHLERVLVEAWHASAPLVAETCLDLAPLTRMWATVEHDAQVHTSHVEGAWDQTIDALSRLTGVTEGMTWREGHKRTVAIAEMELRFAQFHRAIMGQAAERIRQHAIITDTGPRACARCGAPLYGRAIVGHAHQVGCGGCGATNTVEPGEGWRRFAAEGARLLAHAAALAPYAQMIRAELRVEQYRDPNDVPDEVLADLHVAARHYWTSVLETEAAYVPELRDQVAAKIERHVVQLGRQGSTTLPPNTAWRRIAGSNRR